MKIYFDDGQVANIELLKNEFVDYWLDTMIPLEEAGYRSNTWRNQFFPKTKVPVERLDFRDSQIKIFNKCVKKLKKEFDIAFPGKMHKGQSQEWLNVIHRWVTHGAMTGTNWTLPNASLDDIIKSKYNHWVSYDWKTSHTPDFQILGNRDRFNKLLFDMNCAIHEYEEFVPSPRAEELADNGFVPNDGYHVIQRYFTEGSVHTDCYDMPNEFRKYCTYEPHDLWLPFAVLGKEYYTTWANMDTPAAFDVTNIDKSWYAGFEWQPNSYTSRVLDSDFFKGWLKEHNIPDDPFIIAKLPLGNCTNKKDLDLLSSVRSKVINVEF